MSSGAAMSDHRVGVEREQRVEEHRQSRACWCMPLCALAATAAMLGLVHPVAAQVDSAQMLGPGSYVQAYVRLARYECLAGVPQGLDAALADTKATLPPGTPDERARVTKSLDSAYATLSVAGGCDALVRPTPRVIVGDLDGYPWHTPLASIGSPRDGKYDDWGYFIMTRRRKFAGRAADITYVFTGAHGTERLIKGRVRIPVNVATCGADWLELQQTLLARYPTLQVTNAGDAPAPASTCGNGVQWLADFRNPGTNTLELAMALDRDASGGTAIVLVYPGYTMR